MGRRKAEQSDSLELLLDTICNTFGGIVFLSLLVCLMSHAAGKPSVDPKRAAVQELERATARVELQRADFDLQSLQSRLHASEQLLLRMNNADSAQPESLALIEAGVTLRRHRTELRQRVERAIRMASQNDKEIARQQQQTALFAAQLTTAQEELARKQQSKEIKLRTPMARTSVKQQVPVLLIGNSARELFVVDGAFSREPASPAAREALLDKVVTAAEARRLAGLRITSDEEADQWIKKLSRNLDPDTSHLAFAVWPDSHGQFVVLRDAAVRAGFDYQLIICDTDESLWFGASHSQVQ